MTIPLEKLGQKMSLMNAISLSFLISPTALTRALYSSQQETAPFSELLEALPKDHDEYTGLSGRLWVRTETTRADWAVRLRQHGWFFAGYTSLNRRLPDITGHGTDLCHIVEKWGKL